jgi:hypothetical protein
MHLKVKKGMDALLDRFEKYQVSPVVDPARRCVVKRWVN